MLPTHGAAYGTFLLAYAAEISARRTTSEWVSAARSTSSFLAVATDLELTAEMLMSAGLISLGDVIEVSPPLRALGGRADRSAMLGIARLLLANAPPPWLRLAVAHDGTIAREYVPSKDLAALLWLEPDLDDLLRGTRALQPTVDDDALRKRLGDGAEDLLVEYYSRHGRLPFHVARISDAFGYDIELRAGGIERIEVKAASMRTRGAFHLTRNEYEKSIVYSTQWRLLQVVFDSSVLLGESIMPGQVVEVLELRPGQMANAVPHDTAQFRWTKDAILTLDAGAWKPTGIRFV